MSLVITCCFVPVWSKEFHPQIVRQSCLRVTEPINLALTSIPICRAESGVTLYSKSGSQVLSLRIYLSRYLSTLHFKVYFYVIQAQPNVCSWNVHRLGIEVQVPKYFKY